MLTVDATIPATLATADIPPRHEWKLSTAGINAGEQAAYTMTVGGYPVIAKLFSDYSDPRREVAAYRLATMFPGLVNVPPTVLRSDPRDGGPMSLQYWIDGATPVGSFRTILRSDIVGLASFDYMIGNPDRHPGNVLRAGSRLYAIDHGLAFTGFAMRYGSPSHILAGKRIPQYIVSHMRDRLLPRATLAHAQLDSLLGEDNVNTILQTATLLTVVPTFPTGDRSLEFDIAMRQLFGR